MVTYNIKYFAYAIIGLALATFLVLFVATQDMSNIDFKKVLSLISTTITINTIIWGIFIKWLWKWRIFYPWLVPFPNLSGEWSGTILSNWKEKQLDPIETEVSINQTFFHIQVKIKTGESKSNSIGATFDIDKERGISQLIYSYMNTPKSGVRHRSEIHYGTTTLSFEGFNVVNLEGEYWTSRETTGEIHLKRK